MASLPSKQATFNLEALRASAPSFECYSDSNTHDWWSEDDDGNWVRRNERHIKRELMHRGFRSTKGPEENLSPVEEFLRQRARSHVLDYAGWLAGHDPGYLELFGAKILVTRGPKLIEPCQGDWSVFRDMLTGLLDSGDIPQSAYFHAWIKNAVEMLRLKQWMEGRVLALVGPAGCGKSRMQGLITKMLGDSEAKPMSYL